MYGLLNHFIIWQMTSLLPFSRAIFVIYLKQGSVQWKQAHHIDRTACFIYRRLQNL